MYIKVSSIKREDKHLYRDSADERFAYFSLNMQLFSNQFFRKNLSGIPSECQTDWTQIRPDILSGLIWVQTVCKGYLQMTLVDKEFKK